MVPFRSVNMPLIDGETHAEETDGFLMDMLDYSLDASRIWRDKFEIREVELSYTGPFLAHAYAYYTASLQLTDML
ncbi:hypothetical protein QR680_006746 [Steinernema hermaphroditum]|uniref:Uncharacterized protein n=1 Tax=Steinernema hermaphroditum TaxID=289476 RepID=A0AA39LXK8_9BILA|nr:hypothetical protein QR680_006746 [Steinernema hermaphroditum]